MTNDDLDLGATLRGFTSGQHVFDRYRLSRQLGRGGMGVVWLAHDEKLDRDVALKFLPEEIAQDADAILDMKRETRRALELTHPRIVRIYDFVDDTRRAAVSMEYVDGPTLSFLRRESPTGCLSVEKIAPWVEQLCEALTYAHSEAKIAHRDLKPANIMIDKSGMVKVTDFGISATLTDSTTRASHSAGVSSGTPVYMSPQQMMGEKPAPTDDIYSLGATIYELLTGKPPFYSGNILIQVQNKIPPTMTERRAELGVENVEPIPNAWETAMAACLAKDADQRPQSAAEVLAILEGGKVEVAKLSEMTSKSIRESSDNLSACDTVTNDARKKFPTESGYSRAGNPQVLARRSKRLLYGILAAGTFAVAACGWWFGVHMPEVRRETETARQLELARQETTRKAEEARQAEIVRVAAEKAAAEKAETVRKTAEATRIAAARGGMVVRTTPTGAEVQVGAEALDKSPLTLKNLKLGKYPVRVRLDGYEDWTGEAEVKENDFTHIDVELVRETGALTIATEPSGQNWKIVEAPEDANLPSKSGVTPATWNSLPTGSYKVEFSREGWLTESRTVSVTKNGTISASAEFASGRVEITSTPSGADAFDSNGQLYGKTPLIWPDIPTGGYMMTLRADGYVDVTVSGVLEKGATLRLNAEMKAIPPPSTGKNWKVPGTGIEMVWIAPGAFMMGSPSSESGRNNDEKQHQVTLTKGYWLGKFEVTQGQWKSVMGTRLSGQVVKALNDDTLYDLDGKKQKLRDRWGLSRDADPMPRMGDEQDNLPMYYVNYDEVMEFCRKLTERERASGRLPAGYEYRLPTEAQWEYACRAGTVTATYAGDMNTIGKNNAPVLDAIAWYGGNSSVGFDGRGWDTADWKAKQYPGGRAAPRVVGTKQANAWGLYDMHGNVWEWCSDWYGTYQSGSVTDPTGANLGSCRVYRGGSWIGNADFCRSANRSGSVPGFRFYVLGFRLALSSRQWHGCAARTE